MHAQASEIADLVTGAEVARRLGMSTQRVHQLAVRVDFPSPLGRVGNSIVWKWESVSSWARVNMNFEILSDGSSIVVRELGTRGEWVANWFLAGDRGYRAIVLREWGAPLLTTPADALDWTKRHVVRPTTGD